ncbi:MAG: carbohydrate ABC transporter permease [Eubacteriales bacterium]|nr:carbohydrate ABC transporter permease [Eubacteriales bacterium]
MTSSRSASLRMSRSISLIFLILLGVVWIVPLLWVLLNSFKTNQEFIVSYAQLQGPLDYLTRIIPKDWTLYSYQQLFTGEGINAIANIPTMFINSAIVSIAQTIIVLIITSLSAFAYERLNFKNGDKIFWTLFYLSLFPSAVTVLPLFKICYALGWVNNINALIWPRVAGVMNIFLLRNFLHGIPKELDEAARIDGAGSFRVYLHIIMPSMLPVLMTVGLFAFKGAWNDYFWPSIVMNEPNNQTLTSGLRLLQGQYGNNQWTNLLACCIISIVAPFLFYIFAQRYFLKGINISAAVKG